MTVRIHIERLVFEGLPMSAQAGELSLAAMERELGRLLATEDMGTRFAGNAATPVLPAGTIATPTGASAAVLGVQVAGAVHSALVKQP